MLKNGQLTLKILGVKYWKDFKVFLAKTWECQVKGLLWELFLNSLFSISIYWTTCKEHPFSNIISVIISLSLTTKIFIAPKKIVRNIIKQIFKKYNLTVQWPPWRFAKRLSMCKTSVLMFLRGKVQLRFS